MEVDNGSELTLEYQPNGKGTSATLTVKLAGEVLAVEALNLAKPKARAEFTESLCKDRPGIEREAVESELLKLAADLASQGNGDDKPTDETEPDPLAAMPEAARMQARTMLESSELLKRILDDVGALGVAGERELAATLYLVGTSRLLGRPLAAIVQGPSSSGKSYLVEKVASLFPPEAVVLATQMTPQALFHMKPGSLRHRWVVAGERSRKENDDTAEATRALREMLSAGRLVKLMPMKVHGEIQTVTIDQEGPISYVESTTLAHIFDEDANRCIMLTTDEQKSQTRRIIDRLAAGYGGTSANAAACGIIEQHHALQRMLQGQSVVIPFAERLGELMTPERVEARRAFPQLASMIQASTLLHQLQRKVDSDGRLIAEPDDYQLARHLLVKPLGRLLGGRLSDPAARFLERLRGWSSSGETFTGRDAAREETASRRSVYGWLSELHDAGHVEQVDPARGSRAAVWRLAEGGAEGDCPILPSKEQVFGSGVHACTREATR